MRSADRIRKLDGAHLASTAAEQSAACYTFSEGGIHGHDHRQPPPFPGRASRGRRRIAAASEAMEPGACAPHRRAPALRVAELLPDADGAQFADIARAGLRRVEGLLPGPR